MKFVIFHIAGDELVWSGDAEDIALAFDRFIDAEGGDICLPEYRAAKVTAAEQTAIDDWYLDGANPGKIPRIPGSRWEYCLYTEDLYTVSVYKNPK